MIEKNKIKLSWIIVGVVMLTIIAGATIYILSNKNKPNDNGSQNTAAIESEMIKPYLSMATLLENEAKDANSRQDYETASEKYIQAAELYRNSGDVERSEDMLEKFNDIQIEISQFNLQ